MLVRYLSLVAATLLLPPPQEEFELAASYAPGDRIDGHATLRIDLAEDEATFTVDGENGTDHDKRLCMLHVEDVRWSDTVGSMDAGRVTALTRRFGDVAGAISFEEVGKRMNVRESTSPLDGRTVAYEWDADEDAYARSFDDEQPDDEEVDDARLAGLSVAADLAGFLPGKPVEVGERWTLDGPSFGATLLPLGALDMDKEGQGLIALGSYTGFTAPALPPIPSRWWGAPAFDALDGEVRVMLVEVATKDGRTLARLDVTADLRSEASLASWLREFEMEHFHPDIQEMVVATKLRGSGTLIWDVNLGGPVTWDFDGELDVDLDAAWALTQNKRFELDTSRRLTGMLRSTIEFETPR